MEVVTNIFCFNRLCENLNELDLWSKISKTAIIDNNLYECKFCTEKEIPVQLSLTEDEYYYIDDYLYDRMIGEFDFNGEPSEMGLTYEAIYDLWHYLKRTKLEVYYGNCK